MGLWATNPGADRRKEFIFQRGFAWVLRFRDSPRADTGSGQHRKVGGGGRGRSRFKPKQTHVTRPQIVIEHFEAHRLGRPATATATAAAAKQKLENLAVPLRVEVL